MVAGPGGRVSTWVIEKQLPILAGFESWLQIGKVTADSAEGALSKYRSQLGPSVPGHWILRARPAKKQAGRRA